jgi:hypothetical protein
MFLKGGCLVEARFNQQKLVELCQWFNSLDKDVQINIIDWLTDKEENLSFSPEESDKFESLTNSITELIVQTNAEINTVEKELINAGLDKIVAIALIDFCAPLASPYLDAKILSKMKKTNLKKTVAFILEHVILYNDFQRQNLSDFVSLTGFKDAKSSYRVFVFLKHHYEAVARRQISINSLTDILLQEFDLRQELVKEIVSPISENLLNMSISLVFRELEAINENISELTDRLDSIAKL